MDVQLVGVAVSGLTVGAAVVSVYVKLSLPAYTVKVLNGRYPTKELMLQQFGALKELIETKLDNHSEKLDGLPCVRGESCPEEYHAKRHPR